MEQRVEACNKELENLSQQRSQLEYQTDEREEIQKKVTY